MIDWPPKLVSDIARRRSVIMIGSGVSRHSLGRESARPPTWREFLEKALNDCPSRDNLAPVDLAIRENDLLHACEWLRSRFDERWIAYLRETFTAPAFAPAEIHDRVLRLDSRIVFSLNFDDIYERHANSIHHGSHIVKNYHDSDAAEFLRGDGNYIIKVHGSLNNADKTIFTQKDYSRARINNTTFYQAFQAALMTNTFVFIGSGHNDPDVNLLLENNNFSFPSSQPHYFLSGADLGGDRIRSLRENRNIKVLTYDPKDDFHSGLITEIDNLLKLVEIERFELAQSTNW